MNRKIRILANILLNGCFLSNAQQITIDTLPFKFYDFVVSLNSDLANKNYNPQNSRIATGIISDISKYSSPDTNKVILKIKNDWKQKNNATDEGETNIKFGLIKKGTNYYIRRLNTEVKYGVTEIGGGAMVEKYLKILN